MNKINLDELMTRALQEELEERTAEYCADTKRHRFSLSYKLWERRALRNLRKNRSGGWTLRKARCVVAAAAVAVSVLLCTTAYAAIVMGRYGFDKKPDHSKLFIEKLHSDKTSFEEYYGLPEEDGWKLTECNMMTMSTSLRYENGGKRADFDQYIIHEGNMGNIDTEYANPEPVSLYEKDDGFILDYGEDGIMMYWLYDGYLLSISSNFAKNETVKLAYSTKIVEF